jgi:uncharacterized lipoprotein YddW (UPF0748 family)
MTRLTGKNGIRVMAVAAWAGCAGLTAACLPASGEPTAARAPMAGDPTAAVAGADAECPGAKGPGDSARRQLRAMWIATVAGIDWPRDTADAAERKKADYRRLLDHAKALNLNAVFVQIRPSADAFYRSPHEPWSQWISGKQGKDPGFDVLEFFIAEAHARDLEFHAWFNPYRVNRNPDLKKLHPSNPARRNPSWVRKYGGGLWYDPGLPQVRNLTTKVVLDVVRKYDIDAVHFDDYFYPYPAGGDFPDGATYRKYGKGKSRAAWRRANVNTLVRELSEQIRGVKEHVRFGISPFGVWRNRSTDPKGSPTRALQSYDDIYADTRTWIKKEWVDYITPQLYWPVGDSRADYKPLVKWWAEQVSGTKVQLTIGQGAYRVGSAGPWKKAGELSAHLTLNAGYPQVRGDVYFSAKDLIGDRLGFASRLRKDHYAVPAIPPLVPGRGGRAPSPVTDVRAEEASGGRGVQVRWTASPGGATAYAVYRVAGKAAECAPVDPAKLLATVRGGRIVDTSAKPGQTYTYQVTALDRLHHESPPGKGATVTAPGG